MQGIAPLSSIFVYGPGNLAGLDTLDGLHATHQAIHAQERNMIRSQMRSQSELAAQASEPVDRAEHVTKFIF